MGGVGGGGGGSERLRTSARRILNTNFPEIWFYSYSYRLIAKYRTIKACGSRGYSETSEQRAPEERASSEQRPTWMERIAFPIETVHLQPPKSGTSELRPTAKSCVPKCKSLIRKTLWKRPRSHAQLQFLLLCALASHTPHDHDGYRVWLARLVTGILHSL